MKIVTKKVLRDLILKHLPDNFSRIDEKKGKKQLNRNEM